MDVGEWTSPWLRRLTPLEGSDRIVIGDGRDICGRVDGRWRCGEEGGELEGVHDVALYGVEPMCVLAGGRAHCGSWPPGWIDEPIAGVTDAVRLRRSEHWACAVRADGAVLCWGHSEHGTLGAAGLVERDEAWRVEGLPPAVDVALGYGHACALTTEREVWCWGWHGALGDGANLELRAARHIADP